MRDEPDYTAQGDPNHAAFVNVTDLVPHPIRDDEIPELRAMWWRQARLGLRLSAEIGVIVIEGGQP